MLSTTFPPSSLWFDSWHTSKPQATMLNTEPLNIKRGLHRWAWYYGNCCFSSYLTFSSRVWSTPLVRSGVVTTLLIWRAQSRVSLTLERSTAVINDFVAGLLTMPRMCKCPAPDVRHPGTPPVANKRPCFCLSPGQLTVALLYFTPTPCRRHWSFY